MKKTKKWLAIIPLTLLSVTLAGMPALTNPVHAAVTQSFSDVPAGHWAYDAVAKLAKAGIVDGYSDKTFQGNKTLSRYEMAFIVAKAMDKFEGADEDNKQLIDKLSSEFAAELNRLGARVAKVEAKTNTWIGGETRMRVVSDNPTPAGGKKLNGSDRFDFRQRIKFWGNINDDLAWTGRLVTNTSNKFGNAEYSSGSEISLDLMNVTAKNLFGLDSMRVGRSALDFYTNGIFGKAGNVDGVTLSKKLGDVNFKGWTGNIKSAGTNGDANQLTTGQLDVKLADNFNLKTGYYWADIKGTSTTYTPASGSNTEVFSGSGSLNTNVGSFKSSQGWTAGVTYKMGKYTLLGDYVSTTLNGAAGLPDNPKGWVVQLSNSKGPDVIFPAVNLVNPSKVGSDAWMVSYRSIDAGAIPGGAGAFDVTAVANTAQPYNIYLHGTDNVNVLYLAYQNVVAKNVIASLEYQDFKIKNRGLTDLTSNKLDKTYMMKIEFFY
ncbi:S-layer homology domain-containing protein [Sporomusa aerivorans]|uniref:S-layer homology domain-containing protein n=1 Tax=Sporomusa aerivorans TaxID=204936 RepID=UPI00352A9131